MGVRTTARSAFETVMGSYNTTYTPSSTIDWDNTDRLFVVGNGTNALKSNALTILKNANTTIGGSLTINQNHTDSSITFPTHRGTSGQMLITDGSGSTSWATPYSGLTNFTESNYSYDSKYGVKLLARNDAQTNVDFVFSPKGTGAILANQPDGTVIGGNNRGDYAVDLQTDRNDASQVALCAYSVILGGKNNSIRSISPPFEDGTWAVIVGGSDNTSSGLSSAIVGGRNNEVSNLCTFIGGGEFNIASMFYSTVSGGSHNTASGFGSLVGGGQGNTASGYGSSVGGGLYNTAQSYGESVFGLYATVGAGNATAYVATDRLFVVGNGTSTSARSNALTILKNGNTTISGSLTAKNLNLSYSAQSSATNLSAVTESVISVNANQTITALSAGSDGKIMYIINAGSGTVTLPSTLGTIAAGKVASLVAVGTTWYRIN